MGQESGCTPSTAQAALTSLFLLLPEDNGSDVRDGVEGSSLDDGNAVVLEIQVLEGLWQVRGDVGQLVVAEIQELGEQERQGYAGPQQSP